MKWVLIVAAVVVGLIALLALIGALSPRRHQACGSARLRQAPEAVWAAITAFADAPSWRTELKSVELLPDRGGKTCYREISSMGPLTLVVESAEPPRRLVTRIDDPELPFGGSWTFRLEPDGGGTRLTITENGEVRNIFFRALSRTVFRPDATLKGYLRALGRKFGETIEPEAGTPDPDPFG